MSKPAINPNELGDLVPTGAHEDNWPSRAMGPKYQEQLKEVSHRTVAVRNRWKCGSLPPRHHHAATEIGDDVAAFGNAAHVCAVHLSGGNVGVLRMDARTGDCALFLRLKRADWFAWADKNKVPRSAGRAFTKRMDRELGRKMLMDARAFKLGLGNVHHPSVLALLCTMSRHDWLHLADEPPEPPRLPGTGEMGSFTLVALPPLPAEFEQCLGLMGHSAAFVKDNAGSDDDEVSLSTRSDAKPIDKVWGAISGGDKVIGSLAHLFEEGATVIHQLADPALFAHGMASFNGAALSHGRFLDKMQRAANAPPLPPPLPPPLYPGDEASYLDPSDDEEPAETAPAAAPVAAAPPKAATPAPRQPQTQPKACAPPKKKRKGSDSDELSDSDESSASGSDTSEEEDATSSSNDGDSDDSDDRDDRNGRPAVNGAVHEAATALETSSKSDSDSPSSAASRKRARRESTPAPALPGLMSDPALLSVLAEMVRPCCARLKKLKRSPGVGFKARHHIQLIDDLKLIEEATSPVALLAAALNIINTLADIQADRFRGDAVLVRCSEAERLCALATQAGEFAMGVRELLKDAHTSADPQ